MSIQDRSAGAPWAANDPTHRIECRGWQSAPRMRGRAGQQPEGRPEGGLEDVRPLELADGRQASVAVHVHLRRLVLDGTLPPGTVLSQVELAKALGVSRTPTHERLRPL